MQEVVLQLMIVLLRNQARSTRLTSCFRGQPSRVSWKAIEKADCHSGKQPQTPMPRALMQEVALQLMIVLLCSQARSTRLPSCFRGQPSRVSWKAFEKADCHSGKPSRVSWQGTVRLPPHPHPGCALLPWLVLPWLILPHQFLPRLFLSNLNVPRQCLFLPWRILPRQLLSGLFLPRLIVPSRCLLCNTG